MTEKIGMVYIAEDGKTFANKDECEKYEEKIKNIRYFIVQHSPDLTETGMFMRESVVAVYSNHGEHKAIVYKWCVSEKKYPILGPSVQGCGFQKHFDILESKNADDWIRKSWSQLPTIKVVGLWSKGQNPLTD